MLIRHLIVDKENANEVIRILTENLSIDRRYRIFNDNSKVYIPVIPDISFEIAGAEEKYIPPHISGEKMRPVSITGSYDRIGEIAVIKIRDTDRAKKLADSLIHSGSGIRSVWLDTGISGNYRVRSLKHLAGDEITESLYTENGVRMLVDIKKVYFSPRLATERLRILSRIKDGDIIIDMFSGIGPFSLLIAKNKNVEIYSIDINPEAISYLLKNIDLNRLNGKIMPVCGDSGIVIKELPPADHIIMNLPHGALKYLESAKQSLRPGGSIQFYFIGDPEDIEATMERIRDAGFEVTDKRIVHGYSPSESMIYLSLKVLD